MEIFNLLLPFFAVSGFSYVLEAELAHPQITRTDRDQAADLKSIELGDAFISVDERGNGKKTMAPEKSVEELKSEMNPVKEDVRDNMTEIDIQSEDGPTQEAFEQQMRIYTITTGLAETKSIEEMMDTDQRYEKVPEDRLTSEAEDNRKPEMENKGSRRLKETLMEAINNSSRLETAQSHNSVTQLESDDQRNYNLQQRIVQEGHDGMLVDGIHLTERTGDTHEDQQNIFTVRQENEEGENVEKAEKWVKVKNARHDKSGKEEVDLLIPPLSTFSSYKTKTISQSQILPVSPLHHHRRHHAPPIPAITPTRPPSASLVRPLFPPSSVAPLSRVNTGYISLAAGEVKSVSLVEDLIIEVLQSSDSKLKKLELTAKPNLDNVAVKSIQVNPVRKEVQTTYRDNAARHINATVQPKGIPFNSLERVTTPKPIDTTSITAHVANVPKHITVSAKLKENNPPAHLTQTPDGTQTTARNKALKVTENKTQQTWKKNKASPPKQLLTKPAAKRERHKPNGKTQRKINRSSKNKTMEKIKETKKNKDSKIQEPSEEPKFLPYFMDHYCPPECICYGRVVQCSDKGVENIPYGIPYSTRYLLLMNNRINSIQLDVLNAYASMEFLVLSNNHLTDGTILGVFVGVSALKRLYLDKNFLESVPTNLPVSLEELRLDNNRLSVMSQAAWVCCPGLLVLSLSSNSLGNGSRTLPEAVFSPLCSLRTLNLDHNQLISVPLGLPLSIKELYLKGNLIEQFRGGAFNGLSELVLLDLSANRLTNKGLLRGSLLSAFRLESLNLGGNRLKRVPRHLPFSLKSLNLEGNFITSIRKAAFSTFQNLEHLGLARNKIFNVAAGAFGMLRVLHQLDLCYNALRQVPRRLPEGLQSLALTNNKIQSVPRDAFCWGNKSVSLSGLVHVQLQNNLIDLGTLDTHAFRCLRGFPVVHVY